MNEKNPNPTPVRCAVVGHPIAHSKSPEIHAHFANQFQFQLAYERVFSERDAFTQTIKHLQQQQMVGCNVTLPFKIEAFELADTHSDDTLWAGAANTLVFGQSQIQAHNTDGRGLVRDICQNLQHPLQGKNILLMGAGGAARGVLRPLLLEQPNAIIIINRSFDKALQWVDSLQQHPDFFELGGHTKVSACAWQDDVQLRNLNYDLILNATASGLHDGFTAPEGVCLNPHGLAYDMMYGKMTPFLKWISSLPNASQTKSADGWGMLVEQAAIAFQIWHHLQPNTQELLAQSRA